MDLLSIYLETLARCSPERLVRVPAGAPRNVVAIGKAAFYRQLQMPPARVALGKGLSLLGRRRGLPHGPQAAQPAVEAEVARQYHASSENMATQSKQPAWHT